jgi:hypothetical protein
MLWCLLTILSVAIIVHRVVFGVCSVLDIHYVATSVHHVVFPLFMANTTPTLAFFCMSEFCWRWKVVGWLFWPKTLPFEYVHYFPKIDSFLFILILFSYIEDNVLIICLDLFV